MSSRRFCKLVYSDVIYEKVGSSVRTALKSMVSQGNSSGVKIAQVLFFIFDLSGIACQGKGPVVKI